MKPRALQDKKVVYLDFDGVLHPCDVFVDPSRPFEPYLEGSYRTAGHKLFEHAEFLESILPDDVWVILSTSWANLPKHSTSWAKKWLPQTMQNRVLGRTLDVWTGPRKFRALPRGHQVLLHANQFTPKRWIALDDDSNGFDACPYNFVQTHWKTGLVSQISRLRDIFDVWSSE